MKRLTVSFQELEQWLARMPVVCEMTPLVPVALRADVRIYPEEEDFLVLLDDRHKQPLGKACIISGSTPKLDNRLPYLHFAGHPPVEAVNRNLPHRIDYVRNHFLLNHQVAHLIETKVNEYQPEIVALFLIDGLSYIDVHDWHAGEIQPCFIDGPSVTYRYLLRDPALINPTVGFASLIGSPSVWSRLQSLEYQFAQGYTYWSPGSNRISDHLFTGIPHQRTRNYNEIVRHLRSSSIQTGTYLQIVREGLDGLAHSKRELQRVEIQSAIAAIKDDLFQLGDLLAEQARSFMIFAVADHGILWKTEVDWKRLPSLTNGHPRYTTSAPPPELADRFLHIVRDSDSYYLCHYPYLIGSIPADDSGVHGGLSYEESCVPFITLRG